MLKREIKYLSIADHLQGRALPYCRRAQSARSKVRQIVKTTFYTLHITHRTLPYCHIALLPCAKIQIHHNQLTIQQHVLIKAPYRHHILRIMCSPPSSYHRHIIMCPLQVPIASSNRHRIAMSSISSILSPYRPYCHHIVHIVHIVIISFVSYAHHIT